MTGNALQPSTAPSAESPRGCVAIGLLTAGRLFVHLIAIIVVLEILCSGFPVVWRYFVQQSIEVPVITQRAYSAYHWMIFNWFIAIPAFLAFDGLLLAWLESRRKPVRWLARVWFASVLFAALLAVTYINVAIVIPFPSLAPLDTDEPAVVE